MTTKYTADIDNLYFARLDEIAQELEAKPLDMMSVSFSESGCRADGWNHNGNGSGLIGFMPDTLVGLGWTKGHAAFRLLSATEQLAYVRRYYLPHKGKLGSVGALYTATFLPALLSHAGDPDFVLTAKGGPLGWAYAPNAVFDRNHDLAITVRELEEAVARNCVGGRWAELVARLEGTDVPEVAIDDGDLRTTAGIQRALERLDYNPGPVDGIPGPKTRAAVVAFQNAVNLTTDGIVGPLTRAALERELSTRA